MSRDERATVTSGRGWAILRGMWKPLLVVVAVGLASCQDKPATATGTAAATATATATGTATATAKATASATSAKAVATGTALPFDAGPWDAGKAVCAPTKGTSAPRGTYRPGLTVTTARRTFTLQADGALEATMKGEGAGKTIARARPGTKLAATAFGEHDVVVFLADQKTSEGVMLQAFASIDGQPAVRVSEDGTGATSVDVVTRDKKAVIAYIDARSVMVPVHARTVEDSGGKVQLGKDAVLFIGGAPDPNVAGTLATSATSAYYLLPIARDATSFGLAVIEIDDPPHEDAKVTWSMYPFGLDPAPIAGTRGTSPAYVARVVPRDGGLGAPHAIELGRIETGGAFHTLGLVADGIGATWLAMETDPAAPRSPVLKYNDGANIVTSTLVCPP
jgi:hypothetical protein